MHSKFASLPERVLQGSKLKKFAIGIGAAAFVAAAATAANAAPAVTAATVNMRTGPSVSYPIITAIPRGAVVEVYACLRSRPWCDVDWEGWRGWVSARYLRYTGGSYRYVPLYEIFPIIGIPVFTGVPIIYPRIRRPHTPRPPRPGVAPTPRPPLPPTVAPRPRPPRVAPAPSDRRIRPAPTPPAIRAPRAVAPPPSPRIVPDRAPMMRPPVSRAPSAPMMAPRPAAPPSAPSGGGGRLRLPGGGGGAAPPSPR
jgi:uncharacterized protein YraI